MSMEDKRKVIIIEDEADIRDVYKTVLQGAGYEVLEGSTGDEALDLANNHAWDLMLLDIMIPSIDGVSILKRINETDSEELRPVIMLTNLDNESLIVECFDHGAAGYLIKTEITPDKIISEVNKWLKS